MLHNSDQQMPKFFGRRKGRTIRKTKSCLLENFLPRIQINESTIFDKDKMFGEAVDRVYMEIGFGDGVHLAGQALKNPRTGFIGLEVFQNGVANLLTLLTGIKQGGEPGTDVSLPGERRDNVRVFADDARLLFPCIPTAFVDKVFLLFPDPWPKKRHANRRFVNPENLRELARIIRPGGILQIATDHPIYKRWTLRTMHECPDFEWTAKCSDDWRNPPADWIETKYQKKAIREGRRPVFFEYKRIV